jgi:hypothetical protein
VTPIIIFGRRGRQVGGRHLPPGIARERERSANSFRSANRRYPRGHNPSSRHQHSQGFYCRGRLAADSWRAQRLPALPPPCRRNTLSKRPICSVISLSLALLSAAQQSERRRELLPVGGLQQREIVARPPLSPSSPRVFFHALLKRSTDFAYARLRESHAAPLLTTRAGR